MEGLRLSKWGGFALARILLANLFRLDRSTFKSMKNAG
jgi:hypothetical protein